MEQRNKSAVITLAVGLALNIGLGAAKLVAGITADSMSVASDAFNNLSDAAVSVVTIIAVWLASRAADHDHPYGHGRYEYIASFILGAVIVAVGIEVLTGGIKRAIAPQPVEFETAVWATLGVSVGVKAFMAVFYTVRGRSVKSDALKAAAVDSLSDSIVTSAVLACALIEKFTGAHIDGYASIAVAAFVLVFAVRILRRTISRLLGERPDPELVAKLNELISAAPNVLSAHDVIINDYGATHKIAEADVVFPSSMSFVAVHAVCDSLEREAYEKLGVRLSVHADPLDCDDERLSALTDKIRAELKAFDASAHDIEIDDANRCVSLDVLLRKDGQPVDEIKKIISALIRSALDYSAEIAVDYI